MKKRNRFIHGLTLLTLIAAFTACASTRAGESADEYVDDSVITNKAKALLGADDFFKPFDIRIVSSKGTVQLSGFANSQAAVDKAGEILRTIKGVKDIRNHPVAR